MVGWWDGCGCCGCCGCCGVFFQVEIFFFANVVGWFWSVDVFFSRSKGVDVSAENRG